MHIIKIRSVHNWCVKALPILIVALIAGGAATGLAFYYQPQPQHDIVSGVEGGSSLPAAFQNATNLTNNEQDSVYGQVAAWNNSVYVLWQDSVSGRNYDIFIKKSTDNGDGFGTPVNLSNNPGFSEHPQLSAYGSSVYAVWADNTPGNREVLFARSADNGDGFDENAQNLSNNTSDSHNQEMTAFGDNVYVVWVDQDDQENTSILFRASNNGGATFGRIINISSSQANFGSFPKVAAYGDDVYVAWNVIGDEADDGLYFAKSSDRGSTFGDVRKLGGSNISGESQVAAYDNTVYVISGGLDTAEVNGLFFLKSTDGGETFADPVMIDAGGEFVNPMNVELVSDSHDVAYVAGQVFAGGNEEILLLPVSGDNATGIINLSNNAKISECPSIAMAGDNIYVVWEDLTPGNHEVLYAKGTKS
jgi:hypothetical protein